MSRKPYIKIADMGLDVDGRESCAIHIAADPITLSELQNIILIEALKKGIPYVPQDHEV